uniref:Uncharacterized protein n=1 Tax=Coccolithus braarudii TaxID=221442 RepID=A0A7S0LD68_9EUKA
MLKEGDCMRVFLWRLQGFDQVEIMQSQCTASSSATFRVRLAGERVGSSALEFWHVLPLRDGLVGDGQPDQYSLHSELCAALVTLPLSVQPTVLKVLDALDAGDRMHVVKTLERCSWRSTTGPAVEVELSREEHERHVWTGVAVRCLHREQASSTLSELLPDGNGAAAGGVVVSSDSAWHRQLDDLALADWELEYEAGSTGSGAVWGFEEADRGSTGGLLSWSSGPSEGELSPRPPPLLPHANALSASMPIPINGAADHGRRDRADYEERGMGVTQPGMAGLGSLARGVSRSLPTPSRLQPQPPPAPRFRPTSPDLFPPDMSLPPASPVSDTPLPLNAEGGISLIVAVHDPTLLEQPNRAVQVAAQRLATSCPARFYAHHRRAPG